MDEIYNDLKNQIYDYTLPKGERLVERKLSEIYGVNRLHVKKALQKLENDDLVLYTPKKGYSVIGVSKKAFLEIAKIREVLERTLFEDVIKNASNEEIELLANSALRKAIFLENNLALDAFNETKFFFEHLYKFSNYEKIVALLLGYNEQIDMMISKTFEYSEGVERSIQNSRNLQEAVLKRDMTLVDKWITTRYENICYVIDKELKFLRD